MLANAIETEEIKARTTSAYSGSHATGAQMSRAQMPMPAKHRGSSAGHSVGDVHVFEQRMVSAPSTHSELSQSFSFVQTEPAAPLPRGPGSQ
jgi:hypothetical protein